MNWILIAAIVAWVIVGTFFYGVEMRGKSLGIDVYEIIIGYIIWLCIFPLVLIYKLGKLTSSAKRSHQEHSNE